MDKQESVVNSAFEPQKNFFKPVEAGNLLNQEIRRVSAIAGEAVTKVYVKAVSEFAKNVDKLGAAGEITLGLMMQGTGAFLAIKGHPEAGAVVAGFGLIPEALGVKVMANELKKEETSNAANN